MNNDSYVNPYKKKENIILFVCVVMGNYQNN